jgi:hypothetical protein
MVVRTDGRTDGQTNRRTEGQKDGRTEGWTDGQKDGQKDRQTDGRMDRVIPIYPCLQGGETWCLFYPRQILWEGVNKYIKIQ